MGAFSPKSKRVQLRLVEIDDAEFILRLRIDPKLSRHISPVEDSLEKQIEWIREYKIREKDKTEFYWIIEGLNGEKYGTCRIYERSFDENSIEGGSLVVAPNSPSYAAFEGSLLGFMYAFSLGIEKMLLNNRKENKSLHKFELSIGAVPCGEDELNIYYELTSDAFDKAKESKLKSYLARYF